MEKSQSRKLKYGSPLNPSDSDDETEDISDHDSIFLRKGIKSDASYSHLANPLKQFTTEDISMLNSEFEQSRSAGQIHPYQHLAFPQGRSVDEKLSLLRVADENHMQTEFLEDKMNEEKISKNFVMADVDLFYDDLKAQGYINTYDEEPTSWKKLKKTSPVLLKPFERIWTASEFKTLQESHPFKQSPMRMMSPEKGDITGGDHEGRDGFREEPAAQRENRQIMRLCQTSTEEKPIDNLERFYWKQYMKQFEVSPEPERESPESDIGPFRGNVSDKLRSRMFRDRWANMRFGKERREKYLKGEASRKRTQRKKKSVSQEQARIADAKRKRLARLKDTLIQENARKRDATRKKDVREDGTDKQQLIRRIEANALRKKQRAAKKSKNTLINMVADE